MKKALELIRVSTLNQAGDDRFSIPAQRTINRKTAEANGLSIVRSIEISDVGGADVLRAPEIQELMRLIESPEIHGVVAREFSRLMRPENLGDFILLQAFAESKTLLFLPDGPIDFSTKTGRVIGGIRALFAGYEKSEFLERSFGAREEMRQQGKCPSAPNTRPYGVGYEDGRGWFYLPEVENVRRAFELFLSGVSSFAALERETGLTRFNLANALRNPIYSGWRVYDKKRDLSRAGAYDSTDGRQSGRRKIARPPDEVIRVRVIDDPIISEQDFARAQSMLDSKRDRNLRARDSNGCRFIYHGFLVCAACGETEYTRIQKSRQGLVQDYYSCRGKLSWLGKRKIPVEDRCTTSYMRRDRLEPHLDVLFSKRLTDPGFIRELVGELDQRLRGTPSSQSKIERLQTHMEKLGEKRQRILDGFFEGLISRDDRDARILAVDRDRGIASATIDAELPTHERVTTDQLVEYFRPLFTWSFLRIEAKRRILFSLVPEIRVSNYVVSGIGVLVPRNAGVVSSTRRPPASVTLEQEALPQAAGQRDVDYVNRRKTVCFGFRRSGTEKTRACR